MWIAYLDHLAYNLDSLWHRASAISKVIFLAFVISAIIVSKNSLFLLFLLLFIFMLMGISNLPVLSLSVLLLYPLFFGLVFAFSRIGEAASFPLVTLLRAVTAAAAILLVLSTTHYTDFFAVLQYAMPLNLGDIMFVTYRSFFLILDSFRNTIKIARLRAAYRFLGFLGNLSLAGRIIGHSLIHAYEANETTQLVMKVRGYVGRIATSKEALRIKPYDFVISFTPRNYGLSEEEIERWVRKVMVLIGIEHLADKIIHYLSGGEKKKVAIAGAMVIEPSLLILDEPFEGLDPRAKHELSSILELFNDLYGTIVILSTHDVDAAGRFADWLYVMTSGNLVLEGQPVDIFKKLSELKKANLQPPGILELTYHMNKQGLDIAPTLSLDKAIEQLIALILSA